MPVFLKKRQPHLVEQMDRDDCDVELLKNTYQQFNTINLLLSQWRRIYNSEIKPLMSKSGEYTLLDIGFGGGDVPVKISEWAQSDGYNLEITAIEIDRRSFEYVQELKTPGNIEFRYCSSSDLVSENKEYDFVISNHVLHHLEEEQTLQVLDESKMLAKKRVVFNDIERSDVGFLLFNIFARLLFRKSYITEDGLTSIKRSYTFDELQQKAPKGWRVKRLFPFRLLLIYDKKQ